MTFRKFWPLYLRAHRLPGTRALHYVATIVGILCAIEAVAARQPWVFVIGIAAAYAIAVSAHWLVERNQPLIGISAFLGAVADLKMCWLALSGRMEGELAHQGILQATSADANASQAAVAPGRPTRLPSVLRIDLQYVRYALLIASTAGLTGGIIDLSDLTEPMSGFVHPLVQLGAPIVAFGGALVAAFAAIVAAQRYANALAAGGAGGSRVFAGTIASGGDTHAPSAEERSLRHACLALLVLGAVAFGLAELGEHGLPDPTHPYSVIAALATLLCVGVAMIWQASSTSRADRAVGCLNGRLMPSLATPNTRGVRVDGRAEFVDLLENLLSFGRRRSILAATLDAASLRPGERLIDVGCGSGELVLMTAPMAAGHDGWTDSTAIGIDATPGMIEIARRRAQEIGSSARFEVGVAEALPLPDKSADAVTSTFFFHHLPSEVKREAMREMWRVLAPGGRMVITDYGWARGFLGLIASFPMRFNYHEYVRPQLDGEIERIIAEERLPEPEIMCVFLGYIRVLRIAKMGRRSGEAG